MLTLGWAFDKALYRNVHCRRMKLDLAAKMYAKGVIAEDLGAARIE